MFNAQVKEGLNDQMDVDAVMPDCLPRCGSQLTDCLQPFSLPRYLYFPIVAVPVKNAPKKKLPAVASSNIIMYSGKI